MGQDNSADRKLIIVCGTLLAGGAERVISVLSAFFLRKYGQVEIITWRDAPVFYEIDKRIPIISIPERSGSRCLLLQMLWFRSYVKQSMPYCVLSFLTPFNILTLFCLWGCKIPVLVSNRSDPRFDVCWIKKIIRDFVYCFADGLSVQTNKHKAYFFRCIQKKTSVLPNPVFISREMTGRALDTPKAKWIVSVGRLKRVKNQELLLEAFAEVVRLYPDYSLTIFGEGEMRGQLEQKIKDLGLDGKVDLPGEKKEVHQLMLEAEMFVLTSDYEGMPNALIEAMCLGVPVVSTRVAGAADLIRDHINGILVDVGDREGVARGMIELIENKEEALNIARRGIQLADELGMEAIAEQWVHFIDKGVFRKNSKMY